MQTTHVPIRAVTLRGFAALVRELGGDAAGLLAAHGLDEDRISQGGNSFVALDVVERLMEDAAVLLDAPDFGLRLAAQQDIRILGPLAIAMENARSIGEATEFASQYLFIHSPALSLTRVPDPAGAKHVIGLLFASTTGHASPQTLDYGLGIVHRVLTLLNGGHAYGLRNAYLPHSRLAEPAAYARFFQTEVRFDQPDALLRVPAHLMSLPVQGGNDMLRSIAAEHLRTHFVRREAPIADFVFDILDGHRGTEPVELAGVAQALRLHTRVLQRLLKAEGFTFNGIVDDVRRRRAWDLITSTDTPFGQVAAQIGLREQSSLSRAVQRWFGLTPSQLRRSGGGEPPPRLTQRELP